MRALALLLIGLTASQLSAQEHFSGITTSKRVGIMNGNMNPSEFSNLNSRFEVQLFAPSIHVSNNKIGFNDIIGGEDLEELIFNGKGAVDFSVDAEIAGPSFAMKLLKWGFAISSKAHVKANVIDVDAGLGDALTNSASNAVFGSSTISSKENQRVNATIWGEVGLSAARKVYENENHRFNAGVTLKFLFPGSYANFGAGQFEGTITNNLGDVRLNNAHANLNIAYSGSLAESFTEAGDYFNSMFGQLKGMATDLGADYQWKTKGGKGYKLKVGASVRNMGSMTFKGENNRSTNYTLDIDDPTVGGGLDLDQFEDIENFSDVEDILAANHGQNGVTFQKISERKDIKVKLPTVFKMYADIKVISKLSVSLFMQQKMGDDNDNDQVSAQNTFSITPRVSVGWFEAYLPIGSNEISGSTAGFGFRIGGFFLGSNSVISAIASDSKQADFYTGFRFGFL